jgi:glucosyl-3-phosphoglycerate synthase
MARAPDPHVPPRVVRRRALVGSKAGRTVSVVIPARDEATTIGGIVAGASCAELVEACPLVDEDPGGGRPLHRAPPDARAGRRPGDGRLPPRRAAPPTSGPADRGKGGALWKGVARVAWRTTCLAFLDGDVDDFAPRFVVGLLCRPARPRR